MIDKGESGEKEQLSSDVGLGSAPSHGIQTPGGVTEYSPYRLTDGECGCDNLKYLFGGGFILYF